MLVFARDKDDYIVCCNLTVKILANLKRGIELVGLLEEIKKIEEIENEFEVKCKEDLNKCGILIYNLDTGRIEGITKSCENFGLDKVILEDKY
jgi:hypothetical protein